MSVPLFSIASSNKLITPKLPVVSSLFCQAHDNSIHRCIFERIVWMLGFCICGVNSKQQRHYHIRNQLPIVAFSQSRVFMLGFTFVDFVARQQRAIDKPSLSSSIGFFSGSKAVLPLAHLQQRHLHAVRHTGKGFFLQRRWSRHRFTCNKDSP